MRGMFENIVPFKAKECFTYTSMIYRRFKHFRSINSDRNYCGSVVVCGSNVVVDTLYLSS
jgi:hypothetical protein